MAPARAIGGPRRPTPRAPPTGAAGRGRARPAAPRRTPPRPARTAPGTSASSAAATASRRPPSNTCVTILRTPASCNVAGHCVGQEGPGRASKPEAEGRCHGWGRADVERRDEGASEPRPTCAILAVASPVPPRTRVPAPRCSAARPRRRGLRRGRPGRRSCPSRDVFRFIALDGESAYETDLQTARASLFFPGNGLIQGPNLACGTFGWSVPRRVRAGAGGVHPLRLPPVGRRRLHHARPSRAPAPSPSARRATRCRAMPWPPRRTPPPTARRPRPPWKTCGSWGCRPSGR